MGWHVSDRQGRVAAAAVWGPIGACEQANLLGQVLGEWQLGWLSRVSGGRYGVTRRDISTCALSWAAQPYQLTGCTPSQLQHFGGLLASSAHTLHIED